MLATPATHLLQNRQQQKDMTVTISATKAKELKLK
jgi:hypothetical protein